MRSDKERHKGTHPSSSLPLTAELRLCYARLDHPKQTLNLLMHLHMRLRASPSARPEILLPSASPPRRESTLSTQAPNRVKNT